MSTVLFIKANDRPAEQAVSVKLYHTFLETYRASHPEDEVIELDLYKERLPYMDNDMINGIFKSRSGLELSEVEQKQKAVADRYLDQFLAADKVVFAFPLWNLTVPAVLHTYMDYLNRAGKTFRYTPEGAVGLVTDKKIALLNARGGSYSEGPAADAEMAVKLMTMMLQLFGVRDMTTVIIEGHNQHPDQAERLIREGLDRAAAAAARF